MGLPNCRLIVGEHYDRDHFSSDFDVGVEIPQEDRLKLRAHIAMMDEVSNFEAVLANFDKKYIETYPLAVKDLVRIFIGRGSTLPQIFQGKVEEIDAESEAMENYLTLKGRCIGEDLYRRLVTELYQSKKGEVIIKDLLDKYSRLSHARDGVELIEGTDTTYTELEYDKSKLKDVLDFIAKTADKAGVIGFDFRVAYDGKFEFFPRGTKTSPISLVDLIKYAKYSKTVHRIRNRIYAYGAEQKGVPYDKDTWTESLSPRDGAWSAGTGSTTVSLDSNTKRKGSYSIKTDVASRNVYGRTIFTLGDPVNMNLFPNFDFQMLLSSPWIAGDGFEHKLTGEVGISLDDINGRSAIRGINVGTGAWNAQSLRGDRKNAEPWQPQSGFDWSQIKKVSFDVYMNTPGGGATGTHSYWIDNMFFRGRYGISSPHEGCQVVIPQENITDPSDIREMAETDEELYSDAECVARAKALLEWLKDPAEFLNVQTDILDFGSNHLQPADKIPIVLPNENINGNFRILSVDYRLGEEQELPITIELGKETPLLADYLYILRKETSMLARLKGGS